MCDSPVTLLVVRLCIRLVDYLDDENNGYGSLSSDEDESREDQVERPPTATAIPAGMIEGVMLLAKL